MNRGRKEYKVASSPTTSSLCLAVTMPLAFAQLSHSVRKTLSGWKPSEKALGKARYGGLSIAQVTRLAGTSSDDVVRTKPAKVCRVKAGP